MPLGRLSRAVLHKPHQAASSGLWVFFFFVDEPSCGGLTAVFKSHLLCSWFPLQGPDETQLHLAGQSSKEKQTWFVKECGNLINYQPRWGERVCGKVLSVQPGNQPDASRLLNRTFHGPCSYWDQKPPSSAAVLSAPASPPPPHADPRPLPRSGGLASFYPAPPPPAAGRGRTSPR